MEFPETNHIAGKKKPEDIDLSNAKKLENHLKRVNWDVFFIFYRRILFYLLATITSLMVTVGTIKWLLNLLP